MRPSERPKILVSPYHKTLMAFQYFSEKSLLYRKLFFIPFAVGQSNFTDFFLILHLGQFVVV